ncbi:Uncharacterised protein [uncultured Ruminococcus sp.]|nr:Uncharacterised protein [uncultured Ruminococcus sp.]
MKKMKRWLALVLAIALVSTNAIYQLGTHMSASESSQDTSVSEEQPQQEEQAADSQTQDTTEHTDSGQASVQEVTPDQSATATTQQAADVQQAADAQQTEAEQTDVAKTIAVKIQKSDVDGGTVKVVNADGSKSDVTYDGNNQYAKEVTEGESFGFEVTAKDGYQVEQVTDQNGTAIQPASVNGNVSTYNVTDIRSEKVFSVTYNKVETQTEESTDAETEEVQKPGVSEQDTDEENGIALMSISGPTSVEVGSTITLTSDRGGNYDKWSVSDDNKASITANANNSTSAVLTGKKAGNVTVTHSWYSRYLGYWYEQSETFDVTVTKKAMTRIYVYVKLNVAAGVSTSGWNINKDGWYTIGYVDVSSDSVPAADEKNLDRYYPEYSSAVQAALGNIHYYSGNQSVSQGIDLQGSNVNWSASGYGLKIASGASDYGNETGSTKQWHLDGLLTIKKIEKHNVTINYVYEDGSKAADSVIFKDVETGKSVSQTSPNIEGYTADQEKVTVTVLKDDVTVTVTYKKNYPKEKITIKAGSAEKVYDGTPLTEEKYTYTQGILLDGDVLTATTSGSRTEVGTSYNVIAGTAYSIKHGDKDVTSKYNVGLESGTLTVKPQSIVPENPDYRGVTVNKPSDKTYDGKEHKWTPTVKDGDKVLVEGTDYMVSYNKTDYTNVTGAIEVTITGIGNYSGSVTRTYQITPVDVTITTDSDNKPYDGTPLTADGRIEGLVNNEEVSFAVTGSQTAVGSSDNTYTLVWDKTAKETNYNIASVSVGTLTVTESAAEIVVTTTGGTFTYDGQPHGATVSVSTLPTGYTLKTAASTATATNVADGEVTATADQLVIVNAAGEDVTAKLNITYNNGTIKIIPKAATVTTDSAEKVYDGTPLTAPGRIEGLVEGENVTLTMTGNQTVKGESANNYELTWDQNAVSGNYTITDSVGTLKVTEQSLDPKDPESYRNVQIDDPENKTYNGAEQKWAPTVTDAKGNVLVEGTDYTVFYDKDDFTNVTGAIKATITGIGNYKGTVEKSYQILPRELSVTTDSDEKVYDGEPLTAGGSVDGLVAGEELTLRTTGSQTEVGKSNNTYEIVWDKTAQERNYKVTGEKLGTLEVTPQSINPGPNPENPDPSYDGIQIDSPSDVEYDGQAHKWSPTVTDKNGNALTEDTDYEVSYDKDDFTDVKTITVTITGKGNYTGTVTRVYNILAAPLIIRTEKAEKTYDGKPLTNENMTIEGLKNGEVVAHKTTGTQTEVGNSDNTYELDWNSKESTAKESNYIIKEVSLGKLVVKETEDEIVVTTTGGTFTYDGQPHGATVEVSELPEGYTLQTAESDATATDVTTEAVTADADRLVIVNAAGVDVTANLKITRVTGEIVVKPATVTVTTPNASKVYDGTPLTAAGTITGLVNGETVSFATTGTITNVGTATNSYSLVWNQTAKETNYTVSENLGTLTVTAPTNNNPSVTPTPPATPSDNPGVLDRVVDTIKDVAADVQEVFSSDDGDVPLANQNLDEHKCCILHFLIMLLTAILYGFFTHNMKKRQKKNFELREELDTELVKRGLPTSKEQKNS